jgi:ABC-2 type transport system permease protein
VKISRVGAIAMRILKQFRHDRRTVALIVIVPTVVMALIGYLIGDAGKKPLPVAVVNLDAAVQTPAGPVSVGARIEDLLRTDETIEVLAASSEADATEQVRSGEVAGAIVLPADLTQQVLGGGTTQVLVVVGGTEPGLQGPVLAAAQTAVAGLPNTAGGVTGFPAPPLSIRPEPLKGGVELSTLDYNAPVLIAVFAFFFTFLLTSVSFLRERSSGTLERLMASPVTRIEVLVGYLLGFIGFAMIQSLIVLAWAIWVLNVRLAGSIWLVLLVIVILVVGSVNLGIALSFYARNELQVVQFIPLVLLPQIFLGGLFWPVQTLWPPLRYLSQLFPLTHAVAALRAVMIGGATFGDIAGRLLALVALSAAMVVLGVLVLRKQRA